jgi:hypothetical protein
MHGFCLSRNHGRPNKELKLTKPAFGASQLNSVFDGLWEGYEASGK